MASLVAMSFSKDEVEFAMDKLGMWKFLFIDAKGWFFSWYHFLLVSKFHAFLFNPKSSYVLQRHKADFSELL